MRKAREEESSSSSSSSSEDEDTKAANIAQKSAEAKQRGDDAFAAGAHTRPLLSSTLAVFVTEITPSTPPKDVLNSTCTPLETPSPPPIPRKVLTLS